MQNPLSRIALVTGANKGIGLEIAHQLGQAGMIVMLGARDAARGKAAAASLASEDLDVRFILLDLGRPATIRDAAAARDAAHGRLDVLVNNAGIVAPGDGMPGSADLQAVRRVFETNLFGTLAVTQAMLPLLRRSDSGRIVNVSSGLGSLARNSDPDWQFAKVKPIGYNGSKAALNMLTIGLAAELEQTRIKVNAANPGYTATDLNNHGGHQTVPEGAAAAVRLALLPDDGPTGGFFNSAGAEPW